MAEILYADNLKSCPCVRHAFFTKHWGDICFHEDDMPPHALATRERVAAHLKANPQRLLFCRQVHSDDVVTVTDVWEPRDSPIADAMVSDRAGIALGVLTADCLPVLFAADNAPVIGIAHAGWRGALSQILNHTIDAMEKLGAGRESIIAALGPGIGQKSYEVGPEFPALFLAENADNERFFMPANRAGHYQFDLKGYTAAKLQKLGIRSVEIIDADTCAEPERFYSYRQATRRGKRHAGRLVSVITIKHN